MTVSNGPGIILVMIFAALILFTVFLVYKCGGKGILGNRFLLFGAIIVSVIFFLLAKGPIAAYYQSIFKEAPYEFSELKSIVFKYGDEGNLINQYNSASGEYQYLDKRDSLIKTHVNLTKTDLLYLHRKAAELGFWNFPSNEVNTDTTNTRGRKQPEYLVEFNYQRKSKSVLFSVNYDGPQQLVEANQLLIKEIQTVLSGAEDRQKK